METRNDDMLYAITQQTGKGIHGLLDAVFGFLSRKTDFFYQMEPNDKMGFPPGVSESMIYQHFKRYQDEHFKRFPFKPDLQDRWKKFNEEQEKAQKEKKNEPAEIKVEGEKAKKEDIKQDQIKVQSQKVEEKPKLEQNKVSKAPEIKKEVNEKMARISTYNGDATDKYDWSQAITEVVMQIPLPPGTKPKDLDVRIKPKHLYVALKGQPPIVDGELCEKVKVDDTMWSVEDGRFLNINFEKAYEAIWKCIILGDKEIDPKTVDNSKRIEEFDLETQGHLQKVLYEQERKKMGLLTTEEEEQRKLMEKVMQGENSPFQGVPYDPAKYGRNPGNNGPSPPFNM